MDQRVAFVAHKVSFAEILRQVDAAQLRYDPDASADDDPDHPDTPPGAARTTAVVWSTSSLVA